MLAQLVLARIIEPVSKLSSLRVLEEAGVAAASCRTVLRHLPAYAKVHNHGHVLGAGPSPYSLILLGDDMLLLDGEEYDPDQGTWRRLAAGDPSRSNR